MIAKYSTVILTGIVVAVMIVVPGCAGPLDRGAFDDWRRTDRLLYAGRQADLSRVYTHPDRAETLLPLPEQAVLDDYIRFAIKHHPKLEAAFYRWRAALERVPQARSLPDPQASFGIVLDEVDGSTQYMGERYSISQMFPWFGKLELRGDIALEEARAEAQRFEAERLKLVERVTQAYSEYAYLHHAAAIARENRQLMARLEVVALAQFRAGATSQADVNRAQVELGRLDEQVRSMQDMLGSAAADLNSAIGRPAHAKLPAVSGRPSSANVATLPIRSDEQWLALARQINPDLMAMRHEAAAQRRAISLARKEYWPDVMVELEYARDGSARMAMMDGGGSDMVMGKVSVNLPIWRDKLDAGVLEAHARFGEATRRIQDQQNSLESDLKRALFAYRDAQRKLHLYGGTMLPKAVSYTHLTLPTKA
jgi:outer membrane protein TolC